MHYKSPNVAKQLKILFNFSHMINRDYFKEDKCLLLFIIVLR